MSNSTPAELQRLLAEEFERRGWDYDLNVARQLIKQVEETGRVDSAALAQAVPADFIERQRTTRADIGDAIERALGGRVPIADSGGVTTLIIHDHRYSLNMAEGSQISGGNVNVGGTQVNIQVGGSKEDVLRGVETLLRAGLAGDWNADAARELAGVIETRGDVDYEEIAQLTASVADGAAEPKAGRIKSLLTAIAANAIGGAMGTGLSVGLGQALSHLT